MAAAGGEARQLRTLCLGECMPHFTELLSKRIIFAICAQPPSFQASEGLDGAARQLMAATPCGRLLRLPGSALTAALDDLPLPPHTRASSSLQCLNYEPAYSGC
jgi:hypothetical protein